MATNKKSSSALADSENLSENQYFYEDEVCRFDRKGHLHFGLVMETFLANFSDTEDESLLGRGQIKVAWHPNGHEETLDETEVGNFCMSFHIFSRLCLTPFVSTATIIIVTQLHKLLNVYMDTNLLFIQIDWI